MPAGGVDPLITAQDLFTRLDAPDLRLLDASWRLPGSGRDARAEYVSKRLPRAQFFDLEAVADRSSALPHMAPSPEQFASAVRKLGVGDGAAIVVYDAEGIFSASRVWWTFRLMGARDVQVLDGGLPAWEAAGLPLETGPPESAQERHFTARRRNDLVRTITQMQALLQQPAPNILDARPEARFYGRAPEPRPGLRSGHMPGSRNLPYSAVLTEKGRMRSAPELRSLFAHAGVDLRRPVVATCGSGVTAAILALALARLGIDDAAIYDGAWAEWGGRADTAVARDE